VSTFNHRMAPRCISDPVLFKAAPIAHAGLANPAVGALANSAVEVAGPEPFLSATSAMTKTIHDFASMEDDEMFTGLYGAIAEGATTKKFALVAVSLSVAAGLLWAKLAIFPPVAIAEPSQEGIDVSRIGPVAYSVVMPSFDDMYQRHTGVLDVLTTPWRPPYQVSRIKRQGT
jgi:hypothetical protein